MANESFLRREAGVLTFDELTDEQKTACQSAEALLVEMLQSNETVDAPQPHFLPRIDTTRTNRVLLLDGSRGSGKTALLVTLLDHWRRPHNEAQTQPAKKRKPGFRDNPQGRIVPVALLDLHPLPRSINLLLHVVGRFVRVVEWIEGDIQENKEPAWLSTADERESHKRWRSLMSAVAAGWDSNVKRYTAQMDLSAYTEELEVAERERLNLVDTFSAFIDALVEDFSRKKNLARDARPLFVLGIDDADMDPEYSIELLNTVRMLWHPRVAFVLTGDSELFCEMMRVHCLRATTVPGANNDLQSRMPSLAKDIYDKIIPPGHRCELRPIPPGRRLTVNNADLEQRFKKIAVTNGQTLDWYFRYQPQLCEALPDRLRPILDLAAQMNKEIETLDPCATKQNLASRVVRIIWDQALKRGDRRTRLDDSIQVDEESGSLHINLAGDPMAVSAITRAVGRSAVGPRLLLSVLEVHRFTASFNADERKPDEPLPAAITAALMLAANVGFDQDRSDLDNRYTGEKTGYEPFFVVSEFRSRRLAYPLKFPWPLPAGYALPFYAGFSCRWKAVIEPFKQANELAAMTPDNIETLAKHFLQFAITLFRPRNDPHFVSPGIEYQNLADRVVELIANGDERSSVWAAQRAGLLAAPEFGLPAAAANKWLAAIAKALPPARYNDWIDSLYRERRARLDRTVQPELIFHEIDENFANHHWARLIERKEPTITSGGKKKASKSVKPDTASE